MSHCSNFRQPLFPQKAYQPITPTVSLASSRVTSPLRFRQNSNCCVVCPNPQCRASPLAHSYKIRSPGSTGGSSNQASTHFLAWSSWLFKGPSSASPAWMLRLNRLDRFCRGSLKRRKMSIFCMIMIRRVKGRVGSVDRVSWIRTLVRNPAPDLGGRGHWDRDCSRGDVRICKASRSPGRRERSFVGL